MSAKSYLLELLQLCLDNDLILIPNAVIFLGRYEALLENRVLFVQRIHLSSYIFKAYIFVQTKRSTVPV